MLSPDEHDQDGRSRVHYGKYAGLVINNDPPDDGSAHRGQVTVQVPGLLEETADGSGHQAMTVLAAPAFLPGFFFVPEESDQVWVEFVAGDINSPIWTGVWYPDDAAPSTTDATSPGQQGGAPTRDQKMIRTKSGHVVQLDDTDGSEQLLISDETNGNQIKLDQNGVEIIASASGMSVTLTFGQSTVTVKDDSITLSRGQSTVTVDADGVALSASPAAIQVGASGTTITDTTGAAQAVVLKPFYDWITQTFLVWAMTHMHTGNLGAPTTPPMPPPPSPPMPTPTSSLSKP